jgi:hypothetical protein
MRFRQFLKEGPYSKDIVLYLAKDFFINPNDHRYFFDYGFEELNNPLTPERKKLFPLLYPMFNKKFNTVQFFLEPGDSFPFWNRKENIMVMAQKNEKNLFTLRKIKKEEILLVREVIKSISYKHQLDYNGDGVEELQTVKLDME